MSFKPIYKLREWIDERKLNYRVLSKNHNAITLLLKNLDKIDCQEFSSNTHPIAVNMLSCAIHQVDWFNFSANPAAVHVLSQYPHKINYYQLHFNPNCKALDILEKYPDHIDWYWLCRNPDAIHLIRKNMDKIEYDSLSLNENAMDILLENLDKVNWRNLSANSAALPILLNNTNKIDYNMFSVNPGSIPILARPENLNKINWFQLICNPNINSYLPFIENNLYKFSNNSWYNSLNLWDKLCQIPEAIGLIERNLERVDWEVLSLNPSAIHLLEQNQDKINYSILSRNPAIFVLDKDAMRQQIKDFGKRKKNNEDFGFAEELIASALHPRRFERNLIKYNYDICINEYL